MLTLVTLVTFILSSAALYICRGPSTFVENPLLMSRSLYTCRENFTNRLLFMQNKPNFLRGQINATLFAAKDYDNKPPRRTRKNKPKTKPKQTQNKPKTNPILLRTKRMQPSLSQRITTILPIGHLVKTTPIQTQTNPICKRPK